MKYRIAVLGGTFDRIHKGHESLLLHAFSAADRVTIGLTTDEYVSQMEKDPGLLPCQPYAVRKVKLEEWLGGKRVLDRAAIIPISDRYGPTIVDETKPIEDQELDKKAAAGFSCIVVSDDTLSGAEAINKKRVSQGLAELIIERIPLVADASGIPISGTRIRRGDISLSGTLLMPSTLKSALEKPFGVLLSTKEFEMQAKKDGHCNIVGIGDRTVESLLTLGVGMKLAVIDRLSRRKPHPWSADHEQLLATFTKSTIQSGPGYISEQALVWIRKWGEKSREQFKGKTELLVIEGEEDLLTLPVAYYAPVGIVIYYGQPGQGVVRLEITEEVKNRAALLLVQFLQQDTSKNTV